MLTFCRCNIKFRADHVDHIISWKYHTEHIAETVEDSDICFTPKYVKNRILAKFYIKALVVIRP